MATYSPGVKPRVKYVYEDLPEEEKPKSKKDQKKIKRTPPLQKKKFDDEREISTKKQPPNEAKEPKSPGNSVKSTNVKVKCARFTIFACCMVSLVSFN